MAQFYFHLRTPDALKCDGIGLDFPTLEAAYLEACHAIPGMASDLIRERADPMDYAFEIANGSGETLLYVPFSELLAPKAARPGRPSDAANRPKPRSPAGTMKAAAAIYRMAFAAAPLPFLVLTPDFVIAGANYAYCKITGRKPEELVGRGIFEVFPDNPDDPEANGVANLRASFERALKTGTEDTMPLQRHDLRDRHGNWQTRYWSPSNWTVMDEDGAVLAVVHHTREAPAEAATARRARLSISRLAGRWPAV